MVTYNFFNYCPKHFQKSAEQQQVNKFIFAFKDGHKAAAEKVANMVADAMLHTYHEHANDYLIVCAPCSTNRKYIKRFAHFCEVISKRLGSENAMPYISIYGDKKALHNSTSHIVSEDNYKVAVNDHFFVGKKVIIFDDIMTTGKTSETFATKLTKAGANVLGAMFLARTIFFKELN